MELKQVLEAITGVEAKLNDFSKKAEEEAKLAGKASQDTLAAIDGLGVKQRELADRLMALEQKGSTGGDDAPAVDSFGQQFTKSDAYKAFAGGSSQKARVEVKNTVTGSDATVAPDRRPGVVPGATQMLTLESLFNALPTTSNAVEFTRENVFTNNAAEAAEGASKAESALTFTLVNQPVSTIAHWIKISRQLASDNAALAAYINTRMIYGVNRRVEGQLAVGDGSAPNISGIFKSGNYTAHGYLSGAIGTVLPKCVLIRKVVADLKAAGYMADAILLNPVDWAAIEIELLTTVAGQTLLSYNNAGEARLFGVPVVESIGVAADTFAVGAFGQAGTIYSREGVVVELSESDGDNFTKNLVTIRAERRLALAIEVPSAIRGGDLTPAAS